MFFFFLLQALLAEPVGCEDAPTWLYYGNESSIGRLGISNRDFARIGLLYLNGGKWGEKRLISEEHVRLLTSSPVPLWLPRAGEGGTSGAAAGIIPGIGSLGSTEQPDNQANHNGSYSWTWWLNKQQESGQLYRPTAPPDLFGAFGDGRYGPSTMSVLPSQEMVVSWNHAEWGGWNVSKENEAFGLLLEAVMSAAKTNRPLISKMNTFRECGDRLCKDGSPFTVLSGSVHFWRSHPAEWPRRLRLLRDCGFNTVSTYLPWNLLEPNPGKFATNPELDYVRFVREAAAAGLLVSIRAGPYITAEHDFGGYPWWLLQKSNASHDDTFRTTARWFTTLVDRYWDHAIPPLVQLLYPRGGPIISFQIDDDTSGLGGECNTSVPACKYYGYLPYLHDGLRRRGVVDIPITTVGFSPNARTPDILQTVEDIQSIPYDPTRIAASLDKLRLQQPGRPLWVGELYPGHADFVGSSGHYVGDSHNFSNSLATVLKHGASMTMYMASGGSNFGTAGSMLFGLNGSVFSKSITQSYDFDAPINEAGDPHAQKFAAVRAVLCNQQLRDCAEPMPAALPKSAHGRVLMQRRAPLVTVKGQKIATAAVPQTFEELGIGFGIVVYALSTTFAGDATLNLTALRDRGTVLLNGKLQGVIGSWRADPTAQNKEHILTSEKGYGTELVDTVDMIDPLAVVVLRSSAIKPAPQDIAILVENLGRPYDYGSLRLGLNVGWRGISGPVSLSSTVVGSMRWTMNAIDFKELASRNSSDEIDAAWLDLHHGDSGSSGVREWQPSLYFAKFILEAGISASAGTFLRLEKIEWGSGVVAVNGWMLGRFDESSAQRTLYVPRTVLHSGLNEILLAEISTGANSTSAKAMMMGQRGISFVSTADLGPHVPL
eukprot:SAG31_NODE_3204_length_4559_cov_1.961211_3_plen_884_part_00